jgi:hypothetical protein
VTDDDPNTLALSDASRDELWKRIGEALDVAINYAQIDGGHHKMWVIDQMVRHLTGCPTVMGHGISSGNGEPFVYETLGESEDYLEFIRVHNVDDDGEEQYEWDKGIAP